MFCISSSPLPREQMMMLKNPHVSSLRSGLRLMSLRELAYGFIGMMCGIILTKLLAAKYSSSSRGVSSQPRGSRGGGSETMGLQLSLRGQDHKDFVVRDGMVTRRTALCPTNTSAELSVWLHFVQKNAWRMVFDETVGRLESSPLMQHCGASLHLGSPQGDLWNATSGVAPGYPVYPHFEALQRTFPGRVFDTFADGVEFAESGELTTLVKICAWCKKHPNGRALYLHDKGTRRPSGQDSQMDTFFKQADWRRLQEYFLIEIFEDCLHQLDHGWNTCGALLRKWPHLHYSGNFWWARCDYINSLPRIAIWRHYWETHFWAELYLGGSVSWNERKGEDGTMQWVARMFNCYESRVSHYEHGWPRSYYVGKRCHNHVNLTYL